MLQRWSLIVCFRTWRIDCVSNGLFYFRLAITKGQAISFGSLFGHLSSGLAKTILQGRVQGGRRRDRQKKRWENNITEWTGLKFCHAVREAENKIKWRERVATSVAPQRSLDTG